MKIVSVANHKGGSAKTMTAWSLGALLAQRGVRVLLVDFDPQASLTLATGVADGAEGGWPPTIWAAMQPLLETGATVDLAPLIQRLEPDGLDLLPSSLELAAADLSLLHAERREYVLADLLVPAAGAYDLALIDCPPGLTLMVINALTTSAEVVIPVPPDYLGVGGLSLFLSTVDRVRARKLNPALHISGLVATMTRPRTTHDREYLPQLERQAQARGLAVLAQVPYVEAARNAVAAGVPLPLYDPRSPAAHAYADLADRLLTLWGMSAAPAPTPMATEPLEVGRG